MNYKSAQIFVKKMKYEGPSIFFLLSSEWRYINTNSGSFQKFIEKEISRNPDLSNILESQ